MPRTPLSKRKKIKTAFGVYISLSIKLPFSAADKLNKLATKKNESQTKVITHLIEDAFQSTEA